MTTPLAAGLDLQRVAADRAPSRGRRSRRGTRAAARRRGRRSSRPEAASWTGIAFASPARLSTSTIPIAPAAFARARLRDERAVAARDERDRAGRASRPAAGSARVVRVRRRAAEVAVDRLCRPCRRSSRRRRACWSVAPQAAGVCRRPRRRTGSRCRLAGAPGTVTERGREDVRVRDGGDRDRVRRGARRADRAERRSRRGRCPAEITGTTPAAATLWIASISASLAGSVCGPPPEKLITSMPSATAASKAATISGVLAPVADRRRHVEDAVVAEPRARRDAREARHVAGWSAAGRRGRARVAGGDPGDVRAVERVLRGRAAAALRGREPGPGEGARDDHLRRRPLRAALREAGRVREARPGRGTGSSGRRRRRRRRSSRPAPRAAGARPRTRSAPISDGLSVEVERVADARIDLARRSRAQTSSRQLRARAARP